MQFGSGWWFNDTRRGMENQLNSLADQGLLMNFVGMLTDSRSLVSYTRHDYFRPPLAAPAFPKRRLKLQIRFHGALHCMYVSYCLDALHHVQA